MIEKLTKDELVSLINSYNNYIQNANDSNLYNAKEMVLFVYDLYGNKAQSYYNFSYNTSGGESSLGTDFQNVTYTIVTNNSWVTWEYNGSELIANNGTIEIVLYKG